MRTNKRGCTNIGGRARRRGAVTYAPSPFVLFLFYFVCFFILLLTTVFQLRTTRKARTRTSARTRARTHERAPRTRIVARGGGEVCPLSISFFLFFYFLFFVFIPVPFSYGQPRAPRDGTNTHEHAPRAHRVRTGVT